MTRENRQVQDQNALLEQAIAARRYISFPCRNARGEESEPLVEPLAIHYKWYAWYLFAWDTAGKDYRTFKVARMGEVTVHEKPSVMDHGNIRRRMEEAETACYRTCIQIEVHFAESESGLIQEYFPDCPVERAENKCYRQNGLILVFALMRNDESVSMYLKEITG